MHQNAKTPSRFEAASSYFYPMSSICLRKTVRLRSDKPDKRRLYLLLKFPRKRGKKRNLPKDAMILSAMKLLICPAFAKTMTYDSAIGDAKAMKSDIFVIRVLIQLIDKSITP